GYFAQRQLRLEPLPEPTDDWMPRSRGQLVHAILQRLMTALTADGPVPAEALADPKVLDALDEALEAEAARADGGVRCRGLWESELRRLRRHLTDYLTDQATKTLPAQHVLAQEWAFGLGTHGAPPIELDGPAGVVRLQGRIDRVDRILSDGRPKALVIDYKTGALPSVATDVQLPVYIRAAEQLGDLPVAGGAFHGIGGSKPQQRYLAETAVDRGRVKTHDDYAERLAAAEANVHAAVAGIAAGRFGLVTDGKACAITYCPYRRICGHSDARLQRKGARREDADG
ncbi:MAG: PD-(D/E)XK nuclease family protein, partial [Planctomycetota bacterium]